MYAVLKSGGRQYEVRPGQVVKVEKLLGEVGDKVTLDQVLLFSDGTDIQVGQPVLANIAVQGQIVEQGRHRKIVIQAQATQGLPQEAGAPAALHGCAGRGNRNPWAVIPGDRGNANPGAEIDILGGSIHGTQESRRKFQKWP